MHLPVTSFLVFSLLLACPLSVGIALAMTDAICANADVNVACPSQLKLPFSLAVGAADYTNVTAMALAGCSPNSSAIVAVSCTTFSYGNHSSADVSPWICGADASLISCTNVQDYVTSLCVGSSCSGCASWPVGSQIVAGIQCGRSANVDANRTGTVVNRYGDDWSVVQCNEQTEVMVGICISRSSKACPGSTYFGVSCAGFTGTLNVTQTLTQSMSISSSETATDRNRSFSGSLTLTESKSITGNTTPTRTVTLSSTLTRTPTRTPPPIGTRTVSLTGTFTQTYSSTNETTPTPSAIRSFTKTITLPSRTPRLTSTRTVTLVARIYIDSIEPPLSTALVQEKPSQLFISLANGIWIRDGAQFLPLSITGSQPGNPFGFTSRLTSIIQAVSLNTSAVLTLDLRQDPCFEPSGDELVTIRTFEYMTIPAANLTGNFTVSSIDGTVRSAAGLALVTLTVVSALVSMYFEAFGAGLTTLWCIQTLVLIGESSCVRYRAALWTIDAFWVVQPTLENTVFGSLNPRFGVAFLQLIIAVLPTLLCFVLARRYRLFRRFWPVIPALIMSLLVQGTVNAGWFLVLSQDAAVGYRAAAFISMIIFFIWFVAFLRRHGRQMGLVFNSFSSLFARRLLVGTWGPDLLRFKYGPLVDLWAADVRHYAFAAYFALHTVISLLLAVQPSTFPGCIALFSSILVLQGGFFLVNIYIRPARSLPYNTILLLQHAGLTVAIIGTVAALDCSAPYPRNIIIGEVFFVIALVLILLCSIAVSFIAFFERRLMRREALERRQIRRENQKIHLSPPRVQTQDDVDGIHSLPLAESPAVGGSPNTLQHFELREAVAEDDWFNTQVVDEIEMANLRHDLRRNTVASGSPSARDKNRAWEQLPTLIVDEDLPPWQLDDNAVAIKVKKRQARATEVETFMGTHPALSGPITLAASAPYEASPQDRRLLLGTMDPYLCCPRCRRYVGQPELCDACRGPKGPLTSPDTSFRGFGFGVMTPSLPVQRFPLPNPPSASSSPDPVDPRDVL